MGDAVEERDSAEAREKRINKLIKQWDTAVEDSRLLFKGLQQELEKEGVNCEAIHLYVHPERGRYIAKLSDYVKDNSHVNRAVSACLATVICAKQASLSANDAEKVKRPFGYFSDIIYVLSTELTVVRRRMPQPRTWHARKRMRTASPGKSVAALVLTNAMLPRLITKPRRLRRRCNWM